VQLTAVRDLKTGISLDVSGGERTVHFANTGVPHAVVVCSDADSEEVQQTGRAVRNHDYFSPAGANVNFIQIKDRDRIYLRTYERGVEDETYACGTGAAASAVVARHLGLCNPEVGITTSGGEELGILLDADRIFLSGPARLVYRGELDPGEFGL
jgi:diaminopimelate epimerase